MSRSWYIREPGGEDIKVLSFYQAERLARSLSKTNESGLIVVSSKDDKREVVSIFLRGKKRYRGKRARDAVREGLYPTI